MKQIVLILLIFCSSFLWAQSLFESSQTEKEEEDSSVGIDFSGYVRGSIYGASQNYDYSTLFGESSLRGKLFYKDAFLYTEMRLRSGLKFDESFTQFELREAYAGYSGEKFDALLGNQIISWGRTDGFNPTNNITPNDYFFLTADPDDQKLSNFMLRFKYRITTQIDLELIMIPAYRPSIYRYDLFDLGQNVSFVDGEMPDFKFGNSTLAARLNFELSKAGFSLSYFRGYDPFYGFDVVNIEWVDRTPVISNAAAPYLKNTVGADFAIPLGSWITRGEFAYNITSDYEEEMYIPNPDLQYVLALEKSIGGFITIFQYIGKYTLEYSELQAPILLDPMNPLAQLQYANEMILYESSLFNRKIFNQQEEMNHALLLNITKSFAYDTWNAEISGYYNMTSEEYVIRPKLSWKISDALTACTGLSYMYGPEGSLFDYSSPVLSGGFLELKVNF